MVTKKSAIFCHICQRFQVFFSVGNRRKRISGESEVKNKTKTLVWSKIFGFVCFEVKTNTFVNGA